MAESISVEIEGLSTPSPPRRPHQRGGRRKTRRFDGLGALLLWSFLLGTGCAVRSVPPKGQIVEDVSVDAGPAPRVSTAAVPPRLATQATSHFPPFEWLSGVPVLGLFDALTVEYQVFDRTVLQRDLERVQRYYQARGFVEAQVTAGRVRTTARGRVRIEVIVREGEPVWLTTVESPAELLTGAVERGAEREALLEASASVGKLVATYASTPLEEPPRCSLSEGRECVPKPRFDEDRYDDAKRSLQRVLAEAGFAYARVEGHATIDVQRHEAHVRFSVDAGPLCTFGDLSIVGNAELSEAVLRNRIAWKRGARYSTSLLDSVHDELADLGVFGSVEVRAELSPAGVAPEKRVDVKVSVQPVRLRTLKLGGGAVLGSQIEAHGIVGWEDRNFLGGLRTLALEVRPGVVFFPTRADTFFSRAPTDFVPQSALLAGFRQPSFLESRTDLKVDLSGRAYAPQIAPAPEPVPDGYNIVGYYELTGGMGLERRFRFPRFGGTLKTSTFLRAQIDFPFSYNRDKLPPEYARVVIPYVDALATWDQRKDRAGRPTGGDAHRGVYAALDAQVAFGDAVDLRIQPELRLFRPIAKRMVLALRWSFGFLFPFNYGDSLRAPGLASCNELVPAPASCSRDLQLLSFRAFYSGGPFSNRGYGFREVGPHGQLQFATQTGQQAEFLPTGGMGVWELAAELRVAVAQSLSWVLFLDSSDVVRTAADFRVDYPHLAPGTGLRLATPVGPLRLDVGFRPPYLQRLGYAALAVDEGGVLPGTNPVFPWAWSLAIGEAF